jgi:hypothetical protein
MTIEAVLTKLENLTEAEKAILAESDRIDALRIKAEEEARGAKMRAANRGWSRKEQERCYWEAYHATMEG